MVSSMRMNSVKKAIINSKRTSVCNIYMNPAGGLLAKKSLLDLGKRERNLNAWPISLTSILTPERSSSLSLSSLAHSSNFYATDGPSNLCSSIDHPLTSEEAFVKLIDKWSKKRKKKIK